MAPWVGMADEELIKSQVLALSSDSRNFLVDPPPGAQFAFDYDSYASTAVATMAADPELEKMRYELVPKKYGLCALRLFFCRPSVDFVVFSHAVRDSRPPVEVRWRTSGSGHAPRWQSSTIAKRPLWATPITRTKPISHFLYALTHSCPQGIRGELLAQLLLPGVADQAAVHAPDHDQ